MENILFVVYHSPCGSIWPNECFRTAFGMYGEDIEPEVLFIDQGVISLAKETEPKKIGLLSLKMVQKFLKRYDTKVYVEKESMDRYNIAELDENYMAEVIERDKISDLMHSKDCVIYM